MKRTNFRKPHIDRLEVRHCMTAAFLQQSLDGLPLDKSNSQIALGDLDADGDQDLVIGIEFWRENLDGAGRFGAPQRFAPQFITTGTSFFRDVTVADVDSDGDQDIVGSIYPNELIWYENRNGAGRFGPRQALIKEGRTLGDYDLADLNGDGRNELIFSIGDGNGNGFIKIYARSEPSGGFRLAQSLANAGSPFEVVDWDRDGDLDLFTSEGVLYNLAQEGWSAPSGPKPLGHFVIGDLDGDSSPDAVSWFFSGFERIQPGNATATKLKTGFDEFQTPQGVDVVSMTDVDGDRDGDLIIRVHLMDVSGDYLLLNQGSSFSGPIALSSAIFGHGSNTDLFADINGDGKAEGISATRVYEPTGFPLKILHGRAGATPSGQDLADVDHDGDLDLLSKSGTTCGQLGFTCNIKFLWTENLDGQNRFGQPRLIAPFPDATTENIPPITMIDIDNDGDLDALTLTSIQSPTLSWAKNTDGRGTFLQQFFSLNVPSEYTRAQPMDVDADGDNDLVLNENWVENLAVQGGEGFAPPQALIPGNDKMRQIEWHDWDADGDLDLMTHRSSDDFSTMILEFHERTSTSPPLFAKAVIVPSPPPPRYVGNSRFVLTDIDSDGDSDVIIDDSSVKYLRKNDGGALGPWEPILEGIRIIGGLKAIDLDGDQDADLLSGYEDWFENVDGKGQFVQRRLPTNYWSDVGDMDGDGDLDLLSGSTWLENRSVGDVNGDGRFNSSDLVAVCAQGLFEYDVEGIADFLTGDWNGDKKFDSADLMFAFQFGKYTVD